MLSQGEVVTSGERRISAEEHVRAAAGGDPIARRRLVEATLPFVHRMIWRLVGRRAEVDDLVQMVYMRAFKSLGTFRGESAFSTWLGTICINVVRARSPQWPATVREEDALQLVAGGHDTEAQVSAREALRHVSQALADLSPRLREAFILHVLEDYEVATVAAMTGASVAATYKAIERARDHIESFAAKDAYLSHYLRRREP
jgi:RNA polymerase sigma-70 factor (ECF subfamily)